jgi:hypothetical protein
MKHANEIKKLKTQQAPYGAIRCAIGTLRKDCGLPSCKIFYTNSNLIKERYGRFNYAIGVVYIVANSFSDRPFYCQFYA